MSNRAAIKAWLVVASIGAVEALKDQGVARWNGPLKALHQHAKTKIVNSYKKYSIDDRYARSFGVGSETIVGKYRLKKSKVEPIKAWLVVVSIGSVVALKDQGIARWNGAIKTLHQHAKTKYKKSIDDRYARSFSVGSEMMVGKY
ncbi:2-nonaprenyl-3-methyl-6-methoxy-1,4-benzoquinol hydroxylase [Tanacetum coccineum]